MVVNPFDPHVGSVDQTPNSDVYIFSTYAMLANGSLADQAFFLAPIGGPSFQVVTISEVHGTLGTDAGTVNVQVTKDTGTAVAGAGTDLLTNNTSAGFNLKGTINTVQEGTLTTTAGALVLAPGDRLSVDFAGTLTAVAGVVVTAMLRVLG